jgi:hypothetical protein
MKARMMTAMLAMCSMSGLAMAQDSKPASKPAAQPAAIAPPGEKAGGHDMTPDAMKKQMEAWQAVANPGEMHAWLAHRVGEWDMVVESTNPMDPTKTEKTNGTTKSHAILGGRFIVSEVKGTMMGMPFEGFEITGYNNATKKFESTWADSMGTALFNSTGTLNDKKQLTLTGEMLDPASGKNVSMRSVVTVKDNDHTTFEMYGPGMDGKEAKMMTITYTRKGGIGAKAAADQIRESHGMPATKGNGGK